jgi:translation initiation factor 3 subunit A
MEHEFLPLDLASKIQLLLSKISTVGGKLSAASSVPEIQLSKYQSALEKLTALRVLQQVLFYVPLTIIYVFTSSFIIPCITICETC